MNLADTPARPGMAARLRAASGRTAGLLERAFAFHSRAGARRAAFAVAALAALLSLLRGQDANWDLRNYHLHNAWSWLEGRLGLDLAPAQLQSYFAPWLDLPYYLLVQHAPAPLAGAVLGALHGLAFVPLAWIAWRLLAADPQRARLAPVLALAGLASAVFLSELGNTMGDNSTAPLVLGALALCLPGERWRAARVLGAGALLGLAVGLKLTNATYAVALGLAVLAAPRPWRERLGAAAGLTAATALVFALVAGPWLYRIWVEFGNPLFPQYNAWFQAPLAAADVTGDMRWRPRDAGEMLWWPLLFTLDPHRVSEIALPQLVWAALYLAAPAALVAWLARRRRSPAMAAAPDAATRMVVVFFVAGFVLWMLVFSIHRYLVVLELLAPLLLWRLMQGAWPAPAGRRLAHAAVVVCALVALAGWNDWGHARWTSTAFAVEKPARPAPATVLLVGDEPHSWRLPFLWKEAAYVGVASNFPESAAYAAAVRERLAGGEALALLVAPADAMAARLQAKDGKAARYNRIAASLLLDRGDCALMRRMAARSRSLALLEPAQSPGGRCSFALEGAVPPGEDARQAHEAEVRGQLEATAAQLASRYGLHLDAGACSRHDSRIGDEHFPYRLCPVALVQGAQPR